MPFGFGNLLAVAAVLSAGALVFLGPGSGDDAVIDWVIARSAVGGLNPYLPIGELAGAYGLVILDADTPPHPRTPAAIVLSLPSIIAPLSMVPIVGRLLVVVSASGLALIVARIARIDWQWPVIVVPLLLHVPPGSQALFYGNASMLVVAMIGLAFLPARDSRWAGLPLGAATALRLWPAVIAIALFVAGRRKTGLGAAAAFVVLNLAGFLLPGITVARVVEGFISSLAHVQNEGNLSLMLLVPPWVIAAALVAFLVWVGFRRDWRMAAAWSIPMALAASPVVWLHYLPVLALSVALIVGREAHLGYVVPKLDRTHVRHDS